MALAPALIALTASAAETARRLAPELGAEIHGLQGRAEAEVIFTDTAEHIRTLFAAGRPVIGLCAAGILIRAVAPLLADKRAEPPVLAVAEDGSSVTPLLGGHHGANALARQIGAVLGIAPALTTAGDVKLGLALDAPPPGWRLANPEAAKPAMAALLAGGGAVISGEAFLQRLFGDLAALLPDEDALRQTWSDPGRRKALLARLEEMGYDAERLADMRRLIEAPDSDIFDVLAYVRFELTPQTRAGRAGRVRNEDLTVHEAEMRAFLDQVLGHYVKDGVGELDPDRLGGLLAARYGTIRDARGLLGDTKAIQNAFVDLQRALYRA